VKISATALTTKVISGGTLTTITYGSSVKETAKTRRHARRRAVAVERGKLESIIDEAFGVEAVEIAPVAVKHLSRVLKAVNAPTMRNKPQPSADNLCLGRVALYAAKFREIRKGAAHIVK